MIPTSPRVTRLTSSAKPTRPQVVRAVWPRSLSMTSIADSGQPQATAFCREVILQPQALLMADHLLGR